MCIIHKRQVGFSSILLQNRRLENSLFYLEFQYVLYSVIVVRSHRSVLPVERFSTHTDTVLKCMYTLCKRYF